jgi:hypothetical protein
LLTIVEKKNTIERKTLLSSLSMIFIGCVLSHFDRSTDRFGWNFNAIVAADAASASAVAAAAAAAAEE